MTYEQLGHPPVEAAKPLPADCSVLIASLAGELQASHQTFVSIKSLIEAGHQACVDAMTLLHLKCGEDFHQTAYAVIREAMLEVIGAAERYRSSSDSV